MPDVRRIIAATDLSDASLHAIDRGFQLAAHNPAHYTLIHALGLDALGPLRDLLGNEAERVAEKAIQHQYDALAGGPARNAGVVADLKIEAGLATRVLASYAAADVLVGGDRRSPAVSAAFSGEDFV